MQGGIVTHAEIHLRGRDRGILVDANAFVRGDANSRKIYGFARDITAANAAEEDRKRLLSELQLLLDSTDEGIFAVDTEGRCTMLNHSAAATLGFKSEELFGEQVHGLFHQRRIDGSMYPEETCPITAVMRDGNPRRITDEVFWNASGQPIAVDYSAAPIVADGLIRGVVVTFTELTTKEPKYCVVAPEVLKKSPPTRLVGRGPSTSTRSSSWKPGPPLR